MIGHENGAGQGENAAAGTGGSVAEHHSPEATNSGVPNSSAVPAAQAEDGDSIYTPSPVSRKPLGCLVEIAETLILTIVIFWLIQTFVAQPYRVEQQSMETTLLPDQYVLVDKLTPRWDPYKRGDIVVFSPPSTWTTDPTPFIKRVIGLAGDKIEIKDDGKVYVNGVALDEPYTYKNAQGVNEPTVPLNETTSWVVPAGNLFVMGDHRQKSDDSRDFGPITESSVIGRAFLRYWPISAFGILQTPSYPGVPATAP